MWGLFTRALTLASSTVRVSVINTSANFMITAILGVMIFSESLPGLWLLGASLLVAGSVIIGRREEAGDKSGAEDIPGGEPLHGRDSAEGAAFLDEGDDDADGGALELDSVKDSDDEPASSASEEDAVLK